MHDKQARRIDPNTSDMDCPNHSTRSQIVNAAAESLDNILFATWRVRVQTVNVARAGDETAKYIFN
ncbi:hypothetical protein [Rhodopseudomonas palustris]|uniref:hypothetical protein n=1 Tax=Rhodopseudomonas palustris TaxID=1076 RepID=UPI0016026B91|nr:hypothetical protein [Rhodopseudomonas palustris]